jgi:gluconolactonase
MRPLSFLLLACAALAQPPRTYPQIGKIIREDPRLDALLPADARIEVLASGFEWTEGPVWDRQAGRLLFSDIPRNSIFQWTEKEGVSLFLKPSGYTGAAAYGDEPGSNGLLFDSAGRLILMEHGDRRVARMDAGGGKRTLVDNWQGKRLNSPNDGVLAANGDLYFTDPIYGLPAKENDPRRELDFCGVYRLAVDGTVSLLTREMSRPNGIAVSPDQRTLYVANSDPRRAVWMTFPLKVDGTVGPGRVFADATAMVDRYPGLPDGLKLDQRGNLFATGPGGVHIYAPDGSRLGRLDTGEATANVGWGSDGATLYITADMYLCRVKTTTRGQGWAAR